MDTHTLSRWAPAGAVKVTDKQSDAVVYLYQSASGRLGAVGYAGKAVKPTFHYTFKDQTRRETYVREFFEGRRATIAFRAEQKAKASAPSTLKLNDILVASWGYDQTNIEWFQVTRLVGPTTVEIRPIAAANIKDTGWASGRTIPMIDQFTGEATRRRVQYGHSVKVHECAHAYHWDGRPRHWSADH